MFGFDSLIKNRYTDMHPYEVNQTKRLTEFYHIYLVAHAVEAFFLLNWKLQKYSLFCIWLRI